MPLHVCIKCVSFEEYKVALVGTRYQCTRCTNKTKTKSAMLPTSLMSFFRSDLLEQKLLHKARKPVIYTNYTNLFLYDEKAYLVIIGRQKEDNFCCLLSPQSSAHRITPHRDFHPIQPIQPSHPLIALEH